MKHKHLLINAQVMQPIAEAEPLEEWLTKLVEVIDMVIAIPAKAVMVGDIGNAGPTGLVGLKTSHASIHVWTPETPEQVGKPCLCQIDVYSCKDFNPQDVLNYIDETMELYYCDYQFIDRDPIYGFKTLENKSIASDSFMEAKYELLIDRVKENIEVFKRLA